MFKTYGIKDSLDTWFTEPTREGVIAEAVELGYFVIDNTVLYDCDWRGRRPAIIRYPISVPRTTRKMTPREARRAEHRILRGPYSIEAKLASEANMSSADRARFYNSLLGPWGRNGLPDLPPVNYQRSTLKPPVQLYPAPVEIAKMRTTKPKEATFWCSVCGKFTTTNKAPCRCP